MVYDQCINYKVYQPWYVMYGISCMDNNFTIYSRNLYRTHGIHENRIQPVNGCIRPIENQETNRDEMESNDVN